MSTLTNEYYAVPMRNEELNRIVSLLAELGWTQERFVDSALDQMYSTLSRPGGFLQFRRHPGFNEQIYAFRSVRTRQVKAEALKRGVTLVDAVYTALMMELEALERSLDAPTQSEVGPSTMDIPTSELSRE